MFLHYTLNINNNVSAFLWKHFFWQEVQVPAEFSLNKFVKSKYILVQHTYAPANCLHAIKLYMHCRRSLFLRKVSCIMTSDEDKRITFC